MLAEAWLRYTLIQYNTEVEVSHSNCRENILQGRSQKNASLLEFPKVMN